MRIWSKAICSCSLLLVDAVLDAVYLVIIALVGKQLLMRAGLNDVLVTQYDDLVGVFDR